MTHERLVPSQEEAAVEANSLHTLYTAPTNPEAWQAKEIKESKALTWQESLATIRETSLALNIPYRVMLFRKYHPEHQTELEAVILEVRAQVVEAIKEDFLRIFYDLLAINSAPQDVIFRYKLALKSLAEAVKGKTINLEDGLTILYFIDCTVDEFVRRGGYDPRSEIPIPEEIVDNIFITIRRSLTPNSSSERRLLSLLQHESWKGQGEESITDARADLKAIVKSIETNNMWALQRDVTNFRKKFSDTDSETVEELEEFLLENQAKFPEFLKQAFNKYFIPVSRGFFIGVNIPLEKVKREYTFLLNKVKDFRDTGLITEGEYLEVTRFSDVVIDTYVEHGGQDPRRVIEQPIKEKAVRTRISEVPVKETGFWQEFKQRAKKWMFG